MYRGLLVCLRNNINAENEKGIELQNVGKGSRSRRTGILKIDDTVIGGDAILC